MHSFLFPKYYEECYPYTLRHTYTHTQQDSPTFPLYTEVMSKGKAKAGEGEAKAAEDNGSPEVPQKKLTEVRLAACCVLYIAQGYLYISTGLRQSREHMKFGRHCSSEKATCCL